MDGVFSNILRSKTNVFPQKKTKDAITTKGSTSCQLFMIIVCLSLAHCGYLTPSHNETCTFQSFLCVLTFSICIFESLFFISFNFMTFLYSLFFISLPTKRVKKPSKKTVEKRLKSGGNFKPNTNEE